MRQAGWRGTCRVSGWFGSGVLWERPRVRARGWGTPQRAGVADGGGHGLPLKRDWGPVFGPAPPQRLKEPDL